MSQSNFAQLAAVDLGATVGPYDLYTVGQSTLVHLKTMTLQNYIDATITVSFWLDDGNGGNSNGNRRLKDHPIAPDETYEQQPNHPTRNTREADYAYLTLP